MRIWLITFESKDTRKVGGLAEVPPRLGEELQSMRHEVEVVVPSHGFVEGEISGLKEISSYQTPYGLLRIHIYEKPVVKHIIVSGGVLDEPEIYSPKYLMDKVKAFSYGVKKYFEELKNIGREPEILHGNDWLSTPSMLAIRVLSSNVKIFYQIHLLSRTIYGLEDITHDIGVDPDQLVRGVYGEKTVREYHSLSNGYADRLGALISDKLLTVSREYVKEVVRRVGLDLEHHVDYIPNATTWRIEEVLADVKEKHVELSSDLNLENIIGSNRVVIRRYLLTKALAMLREYEPIIDDLEFRKYVDKLDTPPFTGGGRVEAFREDGPLVVMTGRVSRQKGIHVLLRGFEKLVVDVPEIKVLMLLLPVWSDPALIEEIVEYSIVFRENLRVVFGRAPSIYRLAHVASNAMAAPSIYEPFGLMALESMVCGSPVVGSYTGGLAETIVDIEKYGVIGTGLHVETGDYMGLVSKLKDLALFMETIYYKPWSSEWVGLVERVESRVLKTILLSNPKAPVKIRESCIRRAGEYTWRRSAEKALRIYGGS